MAETTLAHRIIVGPAARIKDVTADGIVADYCAAFPSRAQPWAPLATDRPDK
jgi:hypothetical protein